MLELKQDGRAVLAIEVKIEELTDWGREPEVAHCTYIDADGDTQDASYVPLSALTALPDLPEVGDELDDDSMLPFGSLVEHDSGEILVKTSEGYLYVAEADGEAFSFRAVNHSGLKVKYVPEVAA